MVINLYYELYSNLEENTLGKRLKKSRILLNLSQSELSKLCNINKSTIQDYESDKVAPSKKAILKLKRILNLDYICKEGYSKFILSDYKNIFKSWRNKNNLTLSEASQLLGIPCSTFKNWENGRHTISERLYYKIENKLKEMQLIT